MEDWKDKEIERLEKLVREADEENSYLRKRVEYLTVEVSQLRGHLSPTGFKQNVVGKDA